MSPNRPHRGAIHAESARILEHHAFPGAQYILRVEARCCAEAARPGQFAHLDCGPALALRRPLSIFRVDPDAGWVEFLYKAVGYGTRALARRSVGERIDLLGPIGVPFRLDTDRPRPLLIGGGVGIPPIVFVADHIRRACPEQRPLVLIGSEVPFPFSVGKAERAVPGIATDGVMPLLEAWGIDSRLTSLQGYAGAFQGYVTDLARRWLDALEAPQRARVHILACGPDPMLEAVAALAHDYDLPCQVSLEEFMACAVGGCAGCTVAIQTPDGPAMKRVCVDGPVFDARQAYPRRAEKGRSRLGA